MRLLCLQTLKLTQEYSDLLNLLILNCRLQGMAGAQGSGAVRGAYWRMSMLSGWGTSTTASPSLMTRYSTHSYVTATGRTWVFLWLLYG